MTITSRGSVLASLSERHPEWHAWLGLFQVARDAIDDPVWNDVVASERPPRPRDDMPLLAGQTLVIDEPSATRLIGALLDRAGVAKLTREATPDLLEAAIAEDAERLGTLANGSGADPALLATVAALATLPVLHACRRAWEAAIPPAWMRASCPICGGWATLAEARGLERSLRLRCGRCGADWHAQVMRCAFCGNVDHAALGTLVAEASGDTRRVDTCARCLGYMKTITTLSACRPEEVRLLDLATVDLDLAALEHGYARPLHRAHDLGARVTPRAPRKWWRR